MGLSPDKISHLNTAIPAVKDVVEIGKTFFEAKEARQNGRLMNEVRTQVKTHVPDMAQKAGDVLETQAQLNEIQKFTELQNAISYRTAAESVETVAAAATEVAEQVGTAATTTAANIGDIRDGVLKAAERMGASQETVATELKGIRVMGKSLIDRADYFIAFAQVAFVAIMVEVHAGTQALKNISKSFDQLICMKAQGFGPEGFARPVHNFISQRIAEVDSRKHHRFFLYHRDTDWYPSFWKIVRESPLPESFCAKSNNLDHLCTVMLQVRRQLVKESPHGKDVILHLLIPSYYPFAIMEPLHFPDELQPFHVEGLTHMGKPFVAFNLPAAPPGLLCDIANVRDPLSHTSTAQIAAGATFLFGGGWVVNGGFLGAGILAAGCIGAGPFAPFVVLPVWWGGMMKLGFPFSIYLSDSIYEQLKEEKPRILGSTQRIG